MVNKFLNLFRKINSLFTGSSDKYGMTYDWADYSGEKASDIIFAKLSAAEPVMISRIGWVELDCILGYCYRPSFKNYIQYIRSTIPHIGWGKEIRKSMLHNAGFFPVTDSFLERFSRLMLDGITQIDVLGTWMKQESFLKKYLQTATKIPLADLEPFHHKEPWSRVLEGKRVLVIHPFKSSVLQQYKQNRKVLFLDKRVLPDCELQVMKAVQSIANNKTPFANWFEALDFMKSEIDATDFDIAIIGCGAYGLPLAAYVKRLGKKSVHMGGATQLLFGIRGKRWEDNHLYRHFFNQHWIKPLPEDYPQNYKSVENGCYW